MFWYERMFWWDLHPDLWDIIWIYCGSLRNAATRRHRFLHLELKCWFALGRLRPETLRRHYRRDGRYRLKTAIYESYRNM